MIKAQRSQACALQAGGQGFESPRLHQSAHIAAGLRISRTGSDQSLGEPLRAERLGTLMDASLRPVERRLLEALYSLLRELQGRARPRHRHGRS